MAKVGAAPTLFSPAATADLCGRARPALASRRRGRGAAGEPSDGGPDGRRRVDAPRGPVAGAHGEARGGARPGTAVGAAASSAGPQAPAQTPGELETPPPIAPPLLERATPATSPIPRLPY